MRARMISASIAGFASAWPSRRQRSQSALAAAAHGRFIPVPGGVLVRNTAGEIIGAVGISGDASDKDEYAAIAGVRAAGLTPHPEAPADDWRDAGL